MKKRFLLWAVKAVGILLCLTGCAGKSSNDAVERSYTQIDQEALF